MNNKKKPCPRNAEKKIDRFVMANQLRKLIEKDSQNKRVRVGGNGTLADILTCAAAWMDENHPNYNRLLQMAYFPQQVTYSMRDIVGLLKDAIDALEYRREDGWTWI